MKFLVDECVDFLLVIWLREQDFDVRVVAESDSGIKDKEVLALAYAEKEF